MQKRSFKPIKLADSLQGFNKNLVNKIGKVDYIIYSNWAKIVGKFFVEYSKPEKITTMPHFSKSHEFEQKKRILHVNVYSGIVVEFQHFQNKILEKINSFFGYQAIQQIKINQNFPETTSDVL